MATRAPTRSSASSDAAPKKSLSRAADSLATPRAPSPNGAHGEQVARETVAAETPEAAANPARARPRKFIRQYELVDRVRAYDPHADEDLLNRAYVFAMRAHGDQARLSGDPYFSHPLEVAGILTDLRADPATIVTALLHDTLEDTAVTRAEIADLFGEEIARLVDGVTKLTRIELTSAETEKAENFRKLILAMSRDVRVVLVKLADRLHNMRTLQFHPKPEKRKRIALETMEIYAPLAGRIGVHRFREELEELAFEELNPSARISILRRLEYLRADGGDAIETVRRTALEKLAAAGVEAEIEAREKRPYSIWRKMQEKNVSFEQLADIYAFRVIVSGVENCYRALGVLHGVWASIPGHFKDYISTPKPNNYRSLHTAVWGPNMQRVEMQIRTRKMHETAERGVAAHWRYKDRELRDESGVSIEIGRGGGRKGHDPYNWLQRVVEMLDHGDDAEEFLENTKLELFRDQVFCFTPKGRLIDLPRGATPLDFAYAVHTRIGDTCVGARVNGRHVPLRTPLRNGDMVEILRSSAARPPANWESLVVTGKARSAIRRLIRASEREEYAKLGRAIAEAAFAEAGFALTDKAMSQALQVLNLTSSEAAFDRIGRSKLSAEEVLAAAYPGHGAAHEPAEVSADRKPCIGPKGTLGAVPAHFAISGLERAAGVGRIGPCCCAVPGDRIVGALVDGGDVEIHTIDCEALARLDPPEESWLDLRWRPKAHEIVNAVGRLLITVRNAPGVLSEITSLIARSDANIANVRFTDRELDFFEIMLDVEVADARRLAQIKAALRASSDVIAVHRLRGEADALAKVLA